MIREQIITPHAGRGGAASKGRGGEIVQRPAARRGAASSSAKSGHSNAASAVKRRGASPGQDTWRKVSAAMPFVGKSLLAVCAAVLVIHVYRTASSSAFFALRVVDVAGASRTPAEQIKSVVRRTAGATGVWRADLEAIRAEVERQPWVRAAVVSRVLPSGVRVRVTERSPRVVVRTGGGRFQWADDDGVLTGGVASTDRTPAFFMRGWDESATDTARKENAERVKKFLELSREWEAAGASARVSEVNLDDLRDVRAQLAGDDSQIEVRLGKDDLQKRLRLALQKLDEERQTPHGALISYVDMTRGGGGIVLGLKSLTAARSALVAGTTETQTMPAVVASPEYRAAIEAQPAVAGSADKHVALAKKKATVPARLKTGGSRQEARAADATRGTIERPRRVGRAG